MNIIVTNVKSGGRGEYIGRAGYGRAGSPLGNPFIVGRDGTRDECVALYERWLKVKISRRDLAVMAELRRLRAIARERTLEISCWCAPARCHGDVVKAALDALD